MVQVYKLLREFKSFVSLGCLGRQVVQVFKQFRSLCRSGLDVFDLGFVLNFLVVFFWC